MLLLPQPRINAACCFAHWFRNQNCLVPCPSPHQCRERVPTHPAKSKYIIIRYEEFRTPQSGHGVARGLHGTLWGAILGLGHGVCRTRARRITFHRKMQRSKILSRKLCRIAARMKRTRVEDDSSTDDESSDDLYRGFRRISMIQNPHVVRPFQPISDDLDDSKDPCSQGFPADFGESR